MVLRWPRDRTGATVGDVSPLTGFLLNVSYVLHPGTCLCTACSHRPGSDTPPRPVLRGGWFANDGGNEVTSGGIERRVLQRFGRVLLAGRRRFVAVWSGIIVTGVKISVPLTHAVLVFGRIGGGRRRILSAVEPMVAV